MIIVTDNCCHYQINKSIIKIQYYINGYNRDTIDTKERKIHNDSDQHYKSMTLKDILKSGLTEI